jgi:hypothetical protein
LNAVARIVGVHPIEAPEPCHLCELVVEGEAQEFDFGEFTQPLTGRDRSYWQMPYDERLLLSSQTQRSYVFFFHYLDRLGFVMYESP